MKRFYVHVAVNDLEGSKAFYSRLFGAEPTVLRHDYAKWMIDDPRTPRRCRRAPATPRAAAARAEW